VRAALGALSSSQRAAVVEIHLNGRPYADVAAEWGVPVGTVKSRVHLALRSARAALASSGGEPPRLAAVS
jgi:RNA polymerase sigma-70 factor (ECF subfamily)